MGIIYLRPDHKYAYINKQELDIHNQVSNRSIHNQLHFSFIISHGCLSANCAPEHLYLPPPPPSSAPPRFIPLPATPPPPPAADLLVLAGCREVSNEARFSLALV